jgi:molybdate transport system ATP-binding protein
MLDIKIYKKLKSFDLDISFVSDDKLIAIVGKSGSGKTTLLRCIAGFEESQGSIKVDNIEWQNLDIQKRDFGVVFQNYALFPNMNVYNNLKFARNNDKKIKELIELMELKGLEDRYPHELSGGEKQRVALARALMNEPRILLLDEPFSALNYDLKQKLYKEIEVIKNNFDTQIILISHDISEVYRLADKVIEISDGKIIKEFRPGKLPLAKVVEKKEKEMIVECEGKIYRIIP